MNIAVYTCVTGGYDGIRPPRLPLPGVELLCYTDRPESVPAPWRAVPLAQAGLDAKDANRYVKMHPHRLPDLALRELTVYVDGSIELVGAIDRFAAQCASQPQALLLYDHPFRDCAYEEALACARFGHTDLWTLAAQMRRYAGEGYPAHAGLHECNVIVRRRDDAVARVMEAWWQEYRRGARRDQLSLGYVAWRAGLPIGSLGPSDPRQAQQVFALHPHAPAPRRLGPALRTRWNQLLLAALPRQLLVGKAPDARG